MIACITPNPAVDRTWEVERLQPGTSNRVQPGRWRAGGKGVNVARVLRQVGVAAEVIAPVGGDAGAEFTRDLVAAGIPHTLTAIEATTRTSLAIVERSGRATLLNERGPLIDDHEWAAFVVAAEAATGHAGAVVVAGSLPPGVHGAPFRMLLRRIAEAARPFLVDVSGAALADAAAAGAEVLKPNRDELAELTGVDDPDAGAAALLTAGAGCVVVSLGADGVLLRARGIRATARVAPVAGGNATGAGDAMVASLALSLRDGWRPRADPDPVRTEDVLRRAVGWSASAVQMPLAGSLSEDRDRLAAETTVEVTVEVTVESEK